MDVLLRIKRLAIQGRLRFTAKAQDEMDLAGLAASDVVESLEPIPEPFLLQGV